jgi:hypothetical protein
MKNNDHSNNTPYTLFTSNLQFVPHLQVIYSPENMSRTSLKLPSFLTYNQLQIWHDCSAYFVTKFLDRGVPLKRGSENIPSLPDLGNTSEGKKETTGTPG